MMTIGLVSIVENPYIAVLLISIGAFSHQCLSTVAATLGGDLFKKDEVATLWVWQEPVHGAVS